VIDTTPSGIRALLDAGEGPQVEFKQYPPPSSVIEQYTHVFGRLDGGIILVGVGPRGDVRGIDVEQASQFITKARRIATRMQARFGLGTVELEGKTIAFVQVFPFGEKRGVVQAQARQRVVKFRQFAIELGLFSISITCLWWYLVVSRSGGSIADNLPPFTQSNVAAILTGLVSLFALIFYGTSFEITPFRFLYVPLAPFIRLAETRRPSEHSDQPEPNPNEPHSDAFEASVDDDEGKSSLGAKSGQTNEAVATREQISEFGAATETADESEPEDLMNEVAERATFFANKLERRTNTYMILGVAIGAVGLFVWAWKLSAVNNTLTFAALAQELLPRITILVFIELLAGFFLRQYRIGIEDFKYFFDIEQRARWKCVAYSIARKSQDKNLLKQVTLALSDNLASPALKKGETTSALEAMKTESNPALEALKLVAETAKDAIGKFGKRPPSA
jgi:hypothetical protein